MATDGIKCKVFKPRFALKNRKNVLEKIVETDSLNIEQERDKPDKIYLWFDSYLFISSKIPPTTEDLRRRFGVDSPTFTFVTDELISFFKKALANPSSVVKFENWGKYLEIVYGDKLSNFDLFIRHTYLTILAKLMVYLYIRRGQFPSRDEIVSILNGQIFQSAGIMNFIEEDFFAWILEQDIREEIVQLIMQLLNELSVYDLKALDEDVFKELYQELVDPEVRHDLGEYYTPDWLAEYMLQDLTKSNPQASILDPSCGSGTFLFTAIKLVIRSLRSLRMKDKDILKHVLENIAGMDIHPLAVIIAKTNYLLALRELLDEREGPLTIPVYLSDSIRLPEFGQDVRYRIKTYTIRSNKNIRFAVPQRPATAQSTLDEIIAKMYEFAKSYERGEFKKQQITNAFVNILKSDKLSEGKENKIFEEDMKLLLKLIDGKKNSIWTFILRNIYKPLAFSYRKFDVVVGNPPWLSMRYMKNPDYQDFLKKESINYSLVDTKSTHLLSLIELATLFFRKSIDIYLKYGGTIAYVMPKSVLVASQHINFRKFENVELVKVIDLEDVKPLFNVPACVLIAKKASK